jgi:hypothetical protein
VTVDKSHLIIGERLYTEGIELIRELVSHACTPTSRRSVSSRETI